MDDNYILEKELDTPENWEPNTILKRDQYNNIIEINVPDDEEENYARNN